MTFNNQDVKTESFVNAKGSERIRLFIAGELAMTFAKSEISDEEEFIDTCISELYQSAKNNDFGSKKAIIALAKELISKLS